MPGHVEQLVTCLTADTCLTAYQARSHTFVEIDHEIISTTILLPSADYAPNFEKVEGGILLWACPSVRPSVLTNGPLLGTLKTEISLFLN